MPRQDATGPMGQGSRTGRGMGPCCGGHGWNDNYGRGRRFLNKGERREVLEEEAEFLKKDLDAIEKELADLK